MSLSHRRVAFALLLPCSALAQHVPVVADPGTPQVAWSTFDGLSPSAVWQRVNTLDYWAIPRVAPVGFYATVDATSAAALRTTLHAVIAGHRIFDYSNGSTPSAGVATHV